MRWFKNTSGKKKFFPVFLISAHVQIAGKGLYGKLVYFDLEVCRFYFLFYFFFIIMNLRHVIAFFNWGMLCFSAQCLSLEFLLRLWKLYLQLFCIQSFLCWNVRCDSNARWTQVAVFLFFTSEISNVCCFSNTFYSRICYVFFIINKIMISR